jgi:hypothetical protein
MLGDAASRTPARGASAAQSAALAVIARTAVADIGDPSIAGQAPADAPVSPSFGPACVRRWYWERFPSVAEHRVLLASPSFFTCVVGHPGRQHRLWPMPADLRTNTNLTALLSAERTIGTLPGARRSKRSDHFITIQLPGRPRPVPTGVRVLPEWVNESAMVSKHLSSSDADRFAREFGRTGYALRRDGHARDLGLASENRHALAEETGKLAFRRALRAALGLRLR